MFACDKGAVICDLAETYHILNYREVPVETLASLCVGLRDNSRIKMKLSGAMVSNELLLMASIVDRLSLLVWAKTKDAEKGRNRPKSIADILLGKNQTSNIFTFDSPEEFEAERQRIIRGE